MGVKEVAGAVVIAAAFGVGIARSQEKGDLNERLAKVRREIKHIDLNTALARLPMFLKRENEYNDFVKRLRVAPEADFKAMLEQGRQMKLTTLKELNEILVKHQSEYVGITEQEVWKRLKNARFRNIDYSNEWLVNILDDLEERCQINIELDARIYKFDTVTINFDKTSARAMLQIMGDQLLFNWIVRGDTLYVYKERHEVLFGGEWIRKKKAAWKARQEALKRATEEAQRKALGEDDK